MAALFQRPVTLTVCPCWPRCNFTHLKITCADRMDRKKYDFGLAGLGVMGRNFLLNVTDNGFSVCGLDVDPQKVAAFLQEAPQDRATATVNTSEFVESLSVPRKIMLLVPAGVLVDQVIAELLPLLQPGDLIIDGGNSFFTDTDRREAMLAKKGLLFMGTGVSGGEKGARFGPSIMPGGSRAAWNLARPVLEAVAAKANGHPCVAWLGPKSAGNYVKMVHNGIEYGLMQLIAEIWDILTRQGGLSAEELHQVFTRWNQGRLAGFLIEITAGILKTTDPETGQLLLDLVLDKARQKGTGKWTSQNAMDLGVPVPAIDAAVSMRGLSAMKAERQAAARLYGKIPPKKHANPKELVKMAENALYAAFCITYAQGFAQLQAASEANAYRLQLSAVARIWQGGCIIRAGMLQDFEQALADGNRHLLLAPGIAARLQPTLPDAAKLLSEAVAGGVAVAALSAALNYFNAFCSESLPLNLVQAQRDCFGAHTYERTDRQGNFHSEWLAK